MLERGLEHVKTSSLHGKVPKKEVIEKNIGFFEKHMFFVRLR